MRGVILSLLIVPVLCGYSQTVSTDSIGKRSRAGIYSKNLGGDSLTSAFCIVIKDEVKPHYHRLHSEQVIVLSGSGTMKLGDSTFMISKGDVIFIKKNTVHSVKTTGTEPLKVISVQSPRFDGSDRVMVEK
jgi:mannose-6-phosphate isomerase-like protein (cupin superfamily)